MAIRGIKKQSNFRKFSTFIIFIIIIAITACNNSSTYNSSVNSEVSNSEVSNSGVSNSDDSQNFNSEVYEFADLSIHFLQLGNKYTGDSVYIKAGETDILIDAGSRTNSSSTLTTYINQYCSDNILEYVIVTHAHQDHIAGFKGSNSNPGIFATYQTEMIIDYPLTNSTSVISSDYRALRDQEVLNGAKHYTALQCYNNEDGAKRSYEVANNITLNILYQKYYEEKTSNENNYSVCVLLSQGDNHFLFTGDLEAAGEKSLAESNDLPHVKVLKGGHHGSKTSNNDVLLSEITPENVCICTCAGTPEYTTNKNNQFPCQETIDRIAVYTENIYVTSQIDESKSSWDVKPMNGNIVVTSTVNEFSIHGSENDLILKETDWFKENRIWPSIT